MTMRLLRLLASVLALVSFAACESSTFRREGALAIETGSNQVRLHNRTDAPVYTFVIEREAAARTDWGTCSNPNTCDGIDPGEHRTIGYDDIAGYGAGAKEAIVYWWHLIPNPGGGYSPDELHSEIIQL
jgi:hypothetical protein